jgi:hypothetical protein
VTLVEHKINSLEVTITNTVLPFGGRLRQEIISECLPAGLSSSIVGKLVNGVVRQPLVGLMQSPGGHTTPCSAALIGGTVTMSAFIYNCFPN